MIGNMARLTQAAFMAYEHAICRPGENDSVLCFVYSNDILFPEPAPALAGIHANKSVARESAEFFGMSRNIRAAYNKGRKKFIGLTLAPLEAVSEAAFLTRSRRRWHCS
jgi:hypothetical protein